MHNQQLNSRGAHVLASIVPTHFASEKPFMKEVFQTHLTKRNRFHSDLGHTSCLNLLMVSS